MLSDPCYNSSKRRKYVCVACTCTVYGNKEITSYLYEYTQESAVSDPVFAEAALGAAVPGTLCQSWHQVRKPDAKQADCGWAKKRQGTRAGGTQAFVVLPTLLVSRQRLGDVNSRTRLAWPYLSPRSAASHGGVTRHAHLNLSSLGHDCASQLAWAGVDRVRAGRTLAGRGGARGRNPRCSKPEIGAHVAPILLLVLQVEILQVDFCSMRSTIWLTAVSGKRNNQIIIQSWVFNSRKASGC